MSLADAARRAPARVIRLQAPELTSLDAWRGAADARREAIAHAVADAVPGLAFTGFVDPGAGPIAGFDHEDLTFRLVPGGAFRRGLSAGEEDLIRHVAEERRPEGVNWYEEFGDLLDRGMATMRPVHTVHVGPLLACASPGRNMTPDDVAGYLASSPFRLPSEAEWEFLARGGVDGELTWRGHEVPDEPWLEATMALGAALANGFGLWGFGVEPELCADAWHGSYEGAPTDGSPRWGDGPRVARGGAGMLYKWQAVGEWQLLLNAMRLDAAGWKYQVTVRPVIGIG